MRLWYAPWGEMHRCLRGHTGGIREISFSPCGYRLVTASSDCTMRLWDARTGEHVIIGQDQDHRLVTAAFSPDGDLLASASHGGTIILLNARTGAFKAALGSHWVEVTKVAFSPDGLLLASADVDDTVMLWNPRTLDLLQKLRFDGAPYVCLSSAHGSSLMMIIGEQGAGCESGSTTDSCDGIPHIIVISGPWLTVKGKRLLWLPPDYRPGSIVGYHNTVAISTRSGKVFSLTFNFRSGRPWEKPKLKRTEERVPPS